MAQMDQTSISEFMFSKKHCAVGEIALMNQLLNTSYSFVTFNQNSGLCKLILS